MECPHCLEDRGKSVEMDLVESWSDSYGHKGNHITNFEGLFWVCPECDHDEEYEGREVDI